MVGVILAIGQSAILGPALVVRFTPDLARTQQMPNWVELGVPALTICGTDDDALILRRVHATSARWTIPTCASWGGDSHAIR